MFRIVSSVGRSWPTHNFHIKVGDNEFETLTEGQLYFVQPFVDAALMVVVNEPAPNGQTQEEGAKIADTVARIRAAAGADLRARRSLEAQAKADYDAGLTVTNIDGAPDASSTAQADAEAKATAKAEADAAAARAQAEADAKKLADDQASASKNARSGKGG